MWHLMGSAGCGAARLKSQSVNGPHATESAPSSAPSLGRRSARELGSTSCSASAARLRRFELGAVSQHGVHDDGEPTGAGADPGGPVMMGRQCDAQASLFYEFRLEDRVPSDHLLRKIDRFLDLGSLRRELAPFYSSMGRPSIDPELLIRMLIVGYCFGIRSERRLCEEVHLNLAYRWFCGLGLDGEVPDHSTFSKNRHGRFRNSDLLRRLFETVLQRCIDEGLVGGEGFAVDASLIQADASDRNRVDGAAGLPPDAAGRAVKEYLAVLDDAAFGAASDVTPKFIEI